ncbi:MAG: type II toxin-antitoxin system RelE/ParE family toxin, partial [Candidatus Omnitrophica bacterium]|nr:type II toxin-antitoxin system RelE/ParE family toxin [Candidatus Omnitrophota bacterium]
MVKYKILIKKSAAKELENIPKLDLKKIIDRIHSLANNPRPPNSQKLSQSELYRIRQGNYRIVSEIKDKDLIIHVV